MWYVFTINKKHMAADPKQAVLSEALKNIEKQFGK
jgi:hypothetical protein